ncbi:MAG TPA: HAMP domain-containing sensor histidine kinase [Gemmataceae bacterium]|jgi:signal transduction histidine kinase|nr:HAMP domain-containing sensor histidine kinase [Gemmataceae bacterium]
MDRREREIILLPTSMLVIALGALAVRLGGGSAALLALGFVCAFVGAVTAIGLGWRLAECLQDYEEALRKSERMRVLGQVSGGLAHQLRNGVAGAKLAVQLHAKSCEAGETESLDMARKQLARVEADLSRFLDLGRDAVPRRPCRVVDLVEEAVSLLRPRCRHADVQLCWEPPASDPVVDGDPGRLGHLLVNLLTNAVEAAGPGGAIEITVDQTVAGDCAVDIWDSGPGPDQAIARRLFQPFATGKSDGVGLGLFVARQAAEAHGGRLNWRRERGRTCFRIELPVHDGLPTRGQPVAAEVLR